MASELTRWAQDYRSDWFKIDPSKPKPHPTPQWVRADEAEAEITRLTAELESAKRGHSVQREALRKQLTQEREDRGDQTASRAVRAAGDELADLVDDHDDLKWHREIVAALTRYRKAGK